MTPLYWVIRVGAEYLDTLHWGILTDRQNDAFRFVTADLAHKQAKAWRCCPEYKAKGVRVVRVVPRKPKLCPACGSYACGGCPETPEADRG